jgi:Holliday junction resolvase RusA-like endonuclease
MPLTTHSILFMPSISIFHPIDSQPHPRLTLEGDCLGKSTEGVITLMELAAQINREHERCQNSVAIGLLHARNAGQYLLQAKHRVPSSKWSVWLAAYCTVPEATAQTYMDMARGWPSVKESRETTFPGVTDDLGPRTQGTQSWEAAQEDRLEEPPLVVDAQLISEAAQRLTFLSLQHPKPESRSRILRTEARKAKPQETEPPPKRASQTTPGTLILWIPGSVTPKARPRVTANGTFLPKRYREWRLRAEGELIMQVHQMHPQPQLPIERAALRIILRGKHRGDGDNAIGSVCDALVGAGIFSADSLKQIPFGSWRHIPEGETGVKIQIEPVKPV